MAFVLGLHIKIGNYTFTRAHYVKVERSANLVADTAIIKVPLTAVLSAKGSLTTVEMAKWVKPGMPVLIKLAYKNEYNGVEFEGYVKRVHPKIPLEIECEDAVYLLRKNNINKAWESVSIKEVLTTLVQGTGLTVSASVPDIKLSPFSIKNAHGAWVLQELRDKYGLTIYIRDNELFAGLCGTDNLGTVAYTLTGTDTNVTNDTSLQYRSKEDVQLRVKAIGINNDNTRTEVELGDSEGALRTLHFYNINTKAELETLAKQELDKLKFDGYEGKIKSFLIPFSTPGMRAVINDELFPQRAGTYYIESVITTWGTGGSRREVELGTQVS